MQWNFDFDELTVHDGAFRYLDMNRGHTSVGIDYFDLNVVNVELNIDDIKIVQDSVFGNINALSCLENRGFRLDNFKGLAKVAPDMLDVKDVEIQTERWFNVRCISLMIVEDYLKFIDNVR